jgi:hypothetical protein
MGNCSECGKKLGILEGYRHPTMGKHQHLCSPCFDLVSESVAIWGEFVRSNSFNMRSSKIKSTVNLEKVSPPFLKVWNAKKEWLGKKGIYIER